MKFQVPGIQQPADDLLRQLCQKNDPHIRPVVIYVVDHGVHSGLLRGKAKAVHIGRLKHPQKSVLREGIALGGDGKTDWSRGVAGFSVKAFDPLLLLQQGNRVAEEFLSFRCELHAPVAADKKLDTQLLLQLPDSSGDTGLGEKELVGRFVDGAAF